MGSLANLYGQLDLLGDTKFLFRLRSASILQQSQLPISAELLSVSPVWRLFVQQSQLPISPAELLSVSPICQVSLCSAVSAVNVAIREVGPRDE